MVVEMEETQEYNDFAEKFKPKKTTDDCYTPEPVYKAVLNWCVEKYALSNARIIRPFWPGGDYKSENYDGDCVVIDNPPFSILTDICRWYKEREIRFFLFAPSLTLFSTCAGDVNYVAAAVSITYENGARVNTSFVTNMGSDKILADAEMHRIIQSANDDYQRRNKTELPKYTYPDCVVTSSMMSYLALHGITFSVPEGSCSFIRALDGQKSNGKSIFGSGFLLSEKAAKFEWNLSPRERKIISKLGNG